MNQNPENGQSVDASRLREGDITSTLATLHTLTEAAMNAVTLDERMRLEHEIEDTEQWLSMLQRSESKHN